MEALNPMCPCIRTWCTCDNTGWRRKIQTKRNHVFNE